MLLRKKKKHNLSALLISKSFKQSEKVRQLFERHVYSPNFIEILRDFDEILKQKLLTINKATLGTAMTKTLSLFTKNDSQVKYHIKIE